MEQIEARIRANERLEPVFAQLDAYPPETRAEFLRRMNDVMDRKGKPALFEPELIRNVAAGDW